MCMSVLHLAGEPPLLGVWGIRVAQGPFSLSELVIREEGAEELLAGSESVRKGSWCSSRSDI